MTAYSPDSYISRIVALFMYLLNKCCVLLLWFPVVKVSLLLLLCDCPDGVWPGACLIAAVVFPCLSEYLCHSSGQGLTPTLPSLCCPLSTPLTTAPLPSLLLFVYCNLTHLLLFPLLPPPPASISPLFAVEWWCAVVSPLRGIISVVWERSNLTCPVRLKEGCVRSDLSHTACILPSPETSGLPSPLPSSSTSFAPSSSPSSIN